MERCNWEAEAARKNRLHWLIRKQGFFLKTKERTIYIRCDRPAPESRHLKRLVSEFGYGIQFTIPED